MGRKVKEDPRLADLRAQEPDIGPAGMICVEAYRTLESTRAVTPIVLGLAGCVVMTGAVPWPAICDWCAWRGLGRRETEVVAAVIARLDVDHARRERERVQEAARAKG